jgi:hypothetical protein
MSYGGDLRGDLDVSYDPGNQLDGRPQGRLTEDGHAAIVGGQQVAGPALEMYRIHGALGARHVDRTGSTYRTWPACRIRGRRFVQAV